MDFKRGKIINVEWHIPQINDNEWHHYAISVDFKRGKIINVKWPIPQINDNEWHHYAISVDFKEIRSSMSSGLFHR